MTKKYRNNHKRAQKSFDDVDALIKNATDIHTKKSAKFSLKRSSMRLHKLDTERISSISFNDEKGNMTEVVCVSYESFIDNEWITIVRFDTCHGGILHRHVRQTAADGKTYVTPTITKKGLPISKLHAWAVSEITHGYWNFRNGFIRRCKNDPRLKGIDFI